MEVEVVQRVSQRELTRDWLVGGGEMGELIRSIDWAETPLGPIESWPPTLRTMVGLLLANRFPLLLWWGPEYVQLYNDAYRPIPGAKHPRSMGQPARECWAEIWHILRPLVDTPYHGGPPTWNDDILLEIDRHGFLEETHFTIAYSPVPDATAPGGIGGVLATVHEITTQVIQARRVAALRDLGARSAEAKTAEEACAIAAEAFGRHDRDVPFALLYLVDGDGRTARLAGRCPAGGDVDESFAPAVISLDADDTTAWPLAAALTDRVQVVDGLDRRFTRVPKGPWADPPRQALVLPVPSSIPQKIAALLVVGISARIELDDHYRGFFELATAQVATALANARAYEEERRRAEALAEIDRAKTAFFSNVSHEFRTPLALMLAPLEDALADPHRPLPLEQRGRLETAHRNSLRLLKLVNTLLDFSRIEAGRVEARYEATDLARFTTDLASNFRSAMDRAGLRFGVDCPPLPAPVHVDRDMWEKIVLNLLSNAFKFTFDGEIAVTLRRAGECVELAVRDTGTGIAPEEIPHLFERFYRAKGARARTHEGTGIGLALVQELVRLHGGAVRVESVPGKGSTFTVSIPAAGPHAPDDQLAPRTLASTSLGASPFVEEALRWLPNTDLGGGREPDVSTTSALPPLEAAHVHDGPTPGGRILLADDNADMRDYVGRLLREHWTVEAVADGKAALEAARRHVPDLVLADVMMPGLDGFELLRALRADPRTSTVPVILLSARAGEEARVEGLQAGADDYVVKPFMARELIARLHTHLTLARMRHEAARQAEAARTEAEAASSAKDVFLATLSHELRQPLGSILGWMRLLQRHDVDAPGRGHIFERLERSVHSLTRLIDDLLDVSSIVTGKMRLNLQPMDLRQPIEVALDSVRAAATAKGIELELALDPRTPPIVGDADRLQQVVWNLLSNAVKFTPDGGRVAVRLHHDSARIAIEVIDSGRGITPEFMPRLFERFTQGAQGPRRAVPGLGLGLAIVRHLVELHGGTITAESPGEGQGSRFTVSLPVETLDPEALTPREHELVFRECGNHPVATCSSCGKSYRLWQLRADSTGKPHACPGCRGDLTASIREHLLSCETAVILRSEALRTRAHEGSDAPGREP
jgi:signal transduction histidine kinase